MTEIKEMMCNKLNMPEISKYLNDIHRPHGINFKLTNEVPIWKFQVQIYNNFLFKIQII